jgi:hypothetical protein
MPLICPTAKGKYFWLGGLDDPNHVDPAQQIALSVQACGSPKGAGQY